MKLYYDFHSATPLKMKGLQVLLLTTCVVFCFEICGLLFYYHRYSFMEKRLRSTKQQSQLQTLDLGQQRNTTNVDTMQESSGFIPNIPRNSRRPSTEYEHLRRTIGSHLTNAWLSLDHNLRNLAGLIEENGDARKLADRILKDQSDIVRHTMNDVDNLTRVDEYASWRETEANELSNIVQKRIQYIQNPGNCSSAKKVVCSLNTHNTKSGLGSHAHHVAYCLMFAYATGRTLILESEQWGYTKEGWNTFFLPLSNTCLSGTGESVGKWEDKNKTDIQVLRLPVHGYWRNKAVKPDVLPEAIPEDLAPRLKRLHGYPFLWWAGQFLTYALRLQPAVQREVEKVKGAIGFKSPIVGVHIRRTDKLREEAKYHGLNKYMIHVEDYYTRLQKKQEVQVKMIFLATDDTSVLPEITQKYPDYSIATNENFTRLAAPGATRYTADGLRSIIIDALLLSQTDFLVCTLSSNVCRQAYALLQFRYPDASDRIRSVDWMYRYEFSTYPKLIAVLPHKPRTPDEIELRPGDMIQVVADPTLDGYTKGRNINLSPKRSGRFPSFKAERVLETAKMPTYPGAENITLL